MSSQVLGVVWCVCIGCGRCCCSDDWSNLFCLCWQLLFWCFSMWGCCGRNKNRIVVCSFVLLNWWFGCRLCCGWIDCGGVLDIVVLILVFVVGVSSSWGIGVIVGSASFSCWSVGIGDWFVGIPSVVFCSVVVVVVVFVVVVMVMSMGIVVVFVGISCVVWSLPI